MVRVVRMGVHNLPASGIHFQSHGLLLRFFCHVYAHRGHRDGVHRRCLASSSTCCRCCSGPTAHEAIGSSPSHIAFLRLNADSIRVLYWTPAPMAAALPPHAKVLRSQPWELPQVHTLSPAATARSPPARCRVELLVPVLFGSWPAIHSILVEGLLCWGLARRRLVSTWRWPPLSRVVPPLPPGAPPAGAPGAPSRCPRGGYPVVRAKPEKKVMVMTTGHGEEENPRKLLDRKREPPLPGQWTWQGVQEGVLRLAPLLEGLREGKSRDQDCQKTRGHTPGTAFWTWLMRKSSRNPMSMASRRRPGLTFGPPLTSSNRGNKLPCYWSCYACSA